MCFLKKLYWTNLLHENSIKSGMYFIKVYVFIVGQAIKGTPMQIVFMWAKAHILHAETTHNRIILTQSVVNLI